MVPTRRPSTVVRWVLRAPLVLYRVHVGRFALGELVLWVYGRPHARVVHVGRRTGQRREVVLEVLERDAATDELLFAAMWGPGSDWYRNVGATPAVEVEIAGRRFRPEQRLLADDEAQAVLDRYRARHRVWAAMMRAWIGRPMTAAAMPVIGLRPAP